MPKAWKNRKLVIDASVLRAAGETEATTSITCREFLDTIFKLSHYVVETDDIRDEWTKHASWVAKQWLIDIERKDKLHKINGRIQNTEFRNKLEETTFENTNLEYTKNNHDAMLKDARLVEAALLADKDVSSCDDKVRKLFALAGTQVKELEQIVWVNPTKEEENAIEWLKNGAKAEKERQLKNFVKSNV
jgi:hypothetical protein